MKNVLILNAGNLGLACLAKFSDVDGYSVHLYSSRGSRSNVSSLVLREGEHCLDVSINPYVSDWEEALSEADIVLLTAPSYMHRAQLSQMQPYLKAGASVGALQCAGGFFWIARECLGEEVTLFGFQRPPYTARKSEDASSVAITGCKSVNHIAISTPNPHCAQELSTDLLHLLGTEVVMCNPVEAMLTNSNPLLHPARLYEIHTRIATVQSGYEVRPLFYEQWGDEASSLYVSMDIELQEIYSVLSKKYGKELNIKPVLDYYGVSSPQALTNKLRSIVAFKGIEAPCRGTENGYILDIESRYFTEDIPFGLMTLKQVAYMLGVETPHIDYVLHWAQDLMQIELIGDDGRVCDGIENPLTINEL